MSLGCSQHQGLYFFSGGLTGGFRSDGFQEKNPSEVYSSPHRVVPSHPDCVFGYVTCSTAQDNKQQKPEKCSYPEACPLLLLGRATATP